MYYKIKLSEIHTITVTNGGTRKYVAVVYGVGKLHET